ncbi:MAG: hypothetical protein L0241_14835 [Planctomycetia bacterium]|nr:hypothetical protein [Planctomycetia bacterium]
MRTSGFLLSCGLSLAFGCSKPLDEPVDPAKAAEVLNAAFGAWKQGESYGELERRQPPIYFNEPEWESGKKLLKYELGPVTLSGRQGRCSVKLTLQDSAEKVTERTIGYQIDTTPNMVITREALGP